VTRHAAYSCAISSVMRGTAIGFVGFGLVLWSLGSGLSARGQEASDARCLRKKATILGSAKSEQLRGTPGDDVIIGLGGDDTIRGLGGEDLLCGDSGDDRLFGGGDRDRIKGNAGRDLLKGGLDIDDLDGGSGRDVLNGGHGTDSLMPGQGSDRVRGGHGLDIVQYSDSLNPIRARLGRGVIKGSGRDHINSAWGLIGTKFNDVLIGSRRSDFLVGFTGHDRILGLGGQDIIYGWGGDDLLDGGSGLDLAAWGFSARPTRVSLKRGRATGEGHDSLKELEAIFGSSHDDRLTGDQQANVIIGAEGQDVLRGLGGNDRLYALESVNDEDRLDGGAGSDIAEFPIGPAIASLETGEATSLDEASATLVAIEGLAGSPDADVLSGDSLKNPIWGGPGEDVLSGRAGNDHIFGEAGIDALDGGEGRDHLNGGRGNDACVNGEVINGCEPATEAGSVSRVGSNPRGLVSQFVRSISHWDHNRITRPRQLTRVLTILLSASRSHRN
jgi:Ca2+-binding RTX toxin-like protein